MEESPKFNQSDKDFIPAEADNADKIEVCGFDNSMNDAESPKPPNKHYEDIFASLGHSRADLHTCWVEVEKDYKYKNITAQHYNELKKILDSVTIYEVIIENMQLADSISRLDLELSLAELDFKSRAITAEQYDKINICYKKIKELLSDSNNE